MALQIAEGAELAVVLFLAHTCAPRLGSIIRVVRQPPGTQLRRMAEV
jgi:hypothetical protein